MNGSLLEGSTMEGCMANIGFRIENTHAQECSKGIANCSNLMYVAT